jgi:hypothetical protein
MPLRRELANTAELTLTCYLTHVAHHYRIHTNTAEDDKQHNLRVFLRGFAGRFRVS